MDQLEIIETEPGDYSLTLVTGATAVDEAVAELDHEPNGRFWQSAAELLIETEAPEIEDDVEFDSEAGLFAAYSSDRGALERLANLMRPIVTDEARLRRLIALADERGFELDD